MIPTINYPPSGSIYNPYKEQEQQIYGPGPYGPHNPIINNIHGGIYNTEISLEEYVKGLNDLKLHEREISLEKYVKDLNDLKLHERERLNGITENISPSIVDLLKKEMSKNNNIWPNIVPIIWPNKSFTEKPIVAYPYYGSPQSLDSFHAHSMNHHINFETVTKKWIDDLREKEKLEDYVEKTEAENEAEYIEHCKIIMDLLKDEDSSEDLKRELIEIAEEIKLLEDKEDTIYNRILNVQFLKDIIGAIREEEMNKRLFKSKIGKMDSIKSESASVCQTHPDTVAEDKNDTITKDFYIPNISNLGNKLTENVTRLVLPLSGDGAASVARLGNKMDNKQDSEMEEKNIVQTLKDDSKLVARRVAARKVVNVARDLLVAMLSAGKTKKEANNIKNTIGLMLQTDDGKAVIGFMIGAMLPLILAQLPEKYHSVAKDMAQEFRVEGLAHFGTVLADLVTGPAFQTAKGLITNAFDEAMEDKEEVKTTGVRAVSETKMETKTDKHDKLEEVQTVHKRNGHATS